MLPPALARLPPQQIAVFVRIPRLLVGDHDVGGNRRSNPHPARKSTPLVVFSIVCVATLLALP